MGMEGESVDRNVNPMDSLGRGDIRKVLQIMDEVKDTEIVRTPEGAKAWEDLNNAMRAGRPDTKQVNDALRVLRPKSPDQGKEPE